MKLRFIQRGYAWFLRPILFRVDPEFVHHIFLRVGAWLGKYRLSQKLVRSIFAIKHNSSLCVKVGALEFDSPIGLSAGFDKDADLINILPALGFGFAQVGSITDQPYAGNPKPRLTRLPRSKGILVNSGLKNIGVEKIVNKIKSYPPRQIPISISIAKTNSASTVDEDRGINDYDHCLKKVLASGVGDIITINISCPNTFGGEPFTEPVSLRKLFDRLFKQNIIKPVWVKMPINLDWREFDQLLDVVVQFPIQAVIIGNLNKNRAHPKIQDEIPDDSLGGISGAACFDLSNALINKTYAEYSDRLVIVGTGGVFNANDAYEMIKNGASLVQLITGMIYEGPQLISQINQDLTKLVKKDGYLSVQNAVGEYHR